MDTIQDDIFPWSSNFTTGIDTIDTQHQKLVALINKLAKHFAHDSHHHLLNEVLDELTDYTLYHFQFEEKLWHSFLPEDELSKQHQQTHAQFIARIQSFRQQIHQYDTTHELLSFLTHWLSFHILDTDRYMAQIVLHLQAGMTLTQAKQAAQAHIQGSHRHLVETILHMYDALSSKTLLLMREVKRRHRAEEKLRLTRQAMDSSLEAMFITDAEGYIVDANPAFCSDVGLSKEAVIGQDIRQVKSCLFDKSCSHQAWEKAGQDGHWAGEITPKHSITSEYTWLSLSTLSHPSGEISHYTGVISSASQLLIRTHQLEEEAHYDALTRLPNRRLFFTLLEHAMLKSQRQHSLLAVCFIDLDGFKAVNDTLGHEVGDQLLQHVAQAMQRSVRSSDVVARLGGDEFIVLLEALHEKEHAMQVMNKVLQHIHQPHQIDDHPVHISASIGISFHPGSAHSIETLIHEADQAMYAAKRAGKARIHIHTGEPYASYSPTTSSTD